MNNKVIRITELVLQVQQTEDYASFNIENSFLNLSFAKKDETMAKCMGWDLGDSSKKLDEMITALEKFLDISKKIKIGVFEGKNIYIGSIVEIMNADRETEEIEVDYDYTEMGAVGMRNGKNIGWLSEMIILDVIEEE